jgi:predicted RNA methylase
MSNFSSHSELAGGSDDAAFSSIDLVGQCLVDKVRCAAFERAIRRVVKTHHHVVDIGTGSGILALFAARAGARKVTAVEYDSYVAHVARENIRANGYENIIEVVEADARNCRFAPDTKFDVVLMEMLTTGLVDEFQVQAINNLHARGVIAPETIFIPQEQQTFAALSHTQFEIYGFQMRMVRHIWKDFSDEPKFTLMSDYEQIGAVHFSAPCDEYCDASRAFTANADGLVNSVHLISKTLIDAEITLQSTLSLNGTVVVPVAEQIVTKDQTVQVNFQYQYGAGYRTFGSIYAPPLQTPCQKLQNELAQSADTNAPDRTLWVGRLRA